jgi:hypothetical protein
MSIGFGYAAATKNTAAANNGISCLRFMPIFIAEQHPHGGRKRVTRLYPMHAPTKLLVSTHKTIQVKKRAARAALKSGSAHFLTICGPGHRWGGGFEGWTGAWHRSHLLSRYRLANFA